MSDLISKEEVLNLIDTAFECGAFDGRYAYENLIDAVQKLIHPLETDCISRQAAIEAIETDCSWDMFDEFGNRTRIGERIIEVIKKVPPSKPERKIGHWEYTQSDYDPNVGNWHCSECKDIVVTCLTRVAEGRIPRYKYCSNCGCRMIEPQGKCRQDMSDLINRQAAIDAFERFIHELGIKDEPYNYGEMALSSQNVPSVEPEKFGDCISRNELLKRKHIIRDDDGIAYKVISVKDVEDAPSVC